MSLRRICNPSVKLPHSWGLCQYMAERSGVSLGSLKSFENTGKISLDSLLKLMHLSTGWLMLVHGEWER